MRVRKGPPAHPGSILRNHHLDPIIYDSNGFGKCLRDFREDSIKDCE
jgi:hypothetical protein